MAKGVLRQSVTAPRFSIISNDMTKIEKQLAQQIQAWLESGDRSDEAVIRGAEMVLRLNRNRNMYMATMRKPSVMATKIERELRKHLAYYSDGLTLAEVERMTEQVMADVAPHIEAEKDVVATAEPEDMHRQMESRRGKREDHDALDASVRALWAKNGERWKRIKEAYATCLTLSQPCDRYEYLKVLKELWYQYKKDMALYDEAKPGTVISDDTRTVSQDAKSARPYISKNLPVLEQLTADGSNEAKRQELLAKVQERVDILLNANEVIKEETMARLAAVGITMQPVGNAG